MNQRIEQNLITDVSTSAEIKFFKKNSSNPGFHYKFY